MSQAYTELYSPARDLGNHASQFVPSLKLIIIILFVIDVSILPEHFALQQKQFTARLWYQSIDRKIDQNSGRTWPGHASYAFRARAAIPTTGKSESTAHGHEDMVGQGDFSIRFSLERSMLNVVDSLKPTAREGLHGEAMRMGYCSGEKLRLLALGRTPPLYSYPRGRRNWVCWDKTRPTRWR